MVYKPVGVNCSKNCEGKINIIIMQEKWNTQVRYLHGHDARFTGSIAMQQIY